MVENRIAQYYPSDDEPYTIEEAYEAAAADPRMTACYAIFRFLKSASVEWSQIDHRNASAIAHDTIARLYLAGIVERHVLEKWTVPNVKEQPTFVELDLTGYGDPEQSENFMEVIRSFNANLAQRVTLCEMKMPRFVDDANSCKTIEWRLTSYGFSEQAKLRTADAPEAAQMAADIFECNPPYPLGSRHDILGYRLVIGGETILASGTLQETAPATPAKKAARTSAKTTDGKVYHACKMIIEHPGMSNVAIERACKLSGGTLSRSPHKEKFDRAKETGVLPRDKDGRVVRDEND